MKRIISTFSAILMLFGLSSSIMTTAKATEFFTIGTAGPNKVYFQIGNAICKMLHKHAISAEHGRKEGTSKPYRCTAPSTGGSTYNIVKIMQGEFQFGLVRSDLQYHSYKGSKPEKVKSFDGLRAVFSVHSEPFQIWARKKAKVKDFDGLKGKVVNIGNPGSSQRETMEVLIEAKGEDASYFKSTKELTASQQVKALCAGAIDAFVYTVDFPNRSMEEAAVCAAKALPIDLTGSEVQKLIDENGFYAKAVIPKNTYSGQKKDITTFGVMATVVTSEDVSEEMVYLVTKAVFENLEGKYGFKDQHDALKFLDPKNMIKNGLSAPLHPGAVKYYKEKGLM